MKTREEIQRRIDYLTKELKKLSKYDYEVGYPLSARITGRSKKYKIRTIPVSKIRIKEELAHISGKLKTLKWVLITSNFNK